MDDWESTLESLLTEKGEAMGVNEIAKALDVPLATMQRRLERSKFVKNSQRKWQLPINGRVNTTEDNNYTEVLVSQVSAIKAYTDVLVAQLDTAVGLIEIHKAFAPSVAAVPEMSNNTTKKLDKRFYTMSDMINDSEKLIKQHKDRIHEDYRDSVVNTDWIAMYIKHGHIGVQPVWDDISSLIMGETPLLAENTLNKMQEFQKKAKED